MCVVGKRGQHGTAWSYGMAPESKFRLTLENLEKEGAVESRAIKKSTGEKLYYKFVKVDTK